MAGYHEINNIKDTGHRCAHNTPLQRYGRAVTLCIEDDSGKYWADNVEYASQVNYCPFCGSKAPTQICKEDMEGDIR